MARRRAAIDQASIARAVRAAKQAGAATVEVRPDGSIAIMLHGAPLRVPEQTATNEWDAV